MMRFSHAWLGIGACGLLSGLFLAPTTAALADIKPHQKSSESVVEITCTIVDSGKKQQMRATGFAWRDSMYVVTALHAVVGCEDDLFVKSEHKKDGSAASVRNSHLEADLALLKLEVDIGLTQLEHSTSVPDVEERFYLYGYPLFAKAMDAGAIQLKWGLGGKAITSLGDAFKSQDLDSLFSNQNYPRPETQILRIRDAIKSGHSGSPIFDKEGRVVAIVDGALLNGTVGANWSVPAHHYLPKLLNSGDPHPESASSWAKAVLRSSVSDAETKTVPIAVTVAQSAQSLQSATQESSDLTLARKVTLGQLGESIGDDDRDSYKTNRSNLELFIGNSEKVSALSFYIYEDSRTGATLGLPAEFDLHWNAGDRVIETTTDSGAVRFIANIMRMSSFDQAMGDGKQAFIDRIVDLAQWPADSNPADFELQNCVTDHQTGGCDPDWPWRQYAEIYTGTDPATGKPVELVMSIEVSDSDLLGYALYSIGDFNEDLTEDDKISYLKIQTGTSLLTDFAVR